MSIKTKRKISEELTEHIVTGIVSEEEMFECEEAFYRKGPTRLQLWDMSGADLRLITTKGMRRFVNRAAQLGKVRRNGRTAVIVQSKLQYGLARMAEVFGKLEALPFEFRVFIERAEALAWLKTKSGSSSGDIYHGL